MVDAGSTVGTHYLELGVFLVVESGLLGLVTMFLGPGSVTKIDRLG